MKKYDPNRCARCGHHLFDHGFGGCSAGVSPHCSGFVEPKKPKSKKRGKK